MSIFGLTGHVGGRGRARRTKYGFQPYLQSDAVPFHVYVRGLSPVMARKVYSIRTLIE